MTMKWAIWQPQGLVTKLAFDQKSALENESYLSTLRDTAFKRSMEEIHVDLTNEPSMEAG